MELSKNNIRYKLALLAILIIGGFLRIVNLDIVPTGFAHDEMDLAINANFFITSGSDQNGNWSPLKLQQAKTNTVMGELAPLLDVPAFIFLGSSVFSARITSAILGTLLILIVYLLSLSLFKKPKLALLTSALLCFNPWGIIASRIGYEVQTAIFFYLVAIYQIISFKNVNKIGTIKLIFKTIVILISIFIAYFSYHGLKFSAPFIIPIITLWVFKNNQINVRRIIAFPMLLIIIFPIVFFIFSFLNRDELSTRNSEIILSIPKSQEISNYERRIALAPNLIESIYSNKYFVILRQLVGKYYEVYNPVVFFETGENFELFSVRNIGYFYIFESIFIVYGLFILFKRYRQEFYLILLLLLTTPIPSVLHLGMSIFYRSGLLLPIIILINGFGLYSLSEMIWNRIVGIKRKMLFVVLTGFYVFNIGYFCYQYYFYYPLVGERDFNFNETLVLKYLNGINNKNQAVILTNSPYKIYRSILFFNKIISKNNVLEIQENFKNGATSNEIKFQNIIITSDCDNKEIFNNLNVVLVDQAVDEKCKEKVYLHYKNTKSKYVRIVSPEDAGEYFRIYNDSVCNTIPTVEYVQLNDINDLRIDKLSKEQFCQKWIVE